MSKTQNISKKLTGDTGLAILSSILASGINFLIHIILARNLSIEDYGSINLTLEVISSVILMADMGTTVALINLYIKYRASEAHDKALFLLQATAIIKISIAATASTIAATYLTSTQDSWFILRGDMKFGPYQYRSEEHTSELQSPAMTSYAVFC